MSTGSTRELPAILSRVEWGWIVGEDVLSNISIENVNTTRLEKYLSKSIPIWGETLGNCAPPGPQS
jgi:hypothetical protein